MAQAGLAGPFPSPVRLPVPAQWQGELPVCRAEPSRGAEELQTPALQQWHRALTYGTALLLPIRAARHRSQDPACTHADPAAPRDPPSSTAELVWERHGLLGKEKPSGCP